MEKVKYHFICLLSSNDNILINVFKLYYIDLQNLLRDPKILQYLSSNIWDFIAMLHFFSLITLAISVDFLRSNLAPRTWGRSTINDYMSRLQNVESVIDLK